MACAAAALLMTWPGWIAPVSASLFPHSTEPAFDQTVPGGVPGSDGAAALARRLAIASDASNASNASVGAAASSCNETFTRDLFRTFVDDRCLATSSLIMECPVDAAETFLAHYGADLQVPNQVLALLSTVAQTCLIFAGTVPSRRSSWLGMALWCLWLGLQASTCLLYLLSASLAVFAYVNATWHFSACLVRAGSAPLLHLAAVPGLAAHPVVGLRLFALLVCLESIATSGQWHERSEAMLRRMAAGPLVLLAAVAVLFWVATLSILFGVLFLPVPLALSACMAVFLAALKMGTRLLKQGQALVVWVRAGMDSSVMAALLWVAVGPWIWLSTCYAFACYRGAGNDANIEVLGAMYGYVFGSIELKLPDLVDFELLASMDLQQAVEHLAAMGDLLNYEPAYLLEGSRIFFTISVLSSALKALLLQGNALLLFATNGRFGAPTLSVADEVMRNQDRKDKDWVRRRAKKNPEALWHASEAVRGDRDFVLEVVGLNGNQLRWADDALRKDRAFVLEAVGKDAGALKWADDALRKDKDLVLEAIGKCGLSVLYADASLRSDRDFVLDVIGKDRYAMYAFQMADEALRKDRAFMIEAMGRNLLAIRYADETLRNDKAFMLDAVGTYGGRVLLETDSALKGDRGFVREVMEKDVAALLYAGLDVRMDRAFVLEAAAKNLRALDYAADSLRMDRAFHLEAASLRVRPQPGAPAADVARPGR